MSASGGSKTEWPEVVGLPVEVAKRKIVNERPAVQVVVLPDGSFVTQEFNPKRVRVFVNSNGAVAKTPKIG